jgi:hypothetical protein
MPWLLWGNQVWLAKGLKELVNKKHSCLLLKKRGNYREWDTAIGIQPLRAMLACA